MIERVVHLAEVLAKERTTPDSRVVLVGDFFFFQAEDGIRDLYVTGVQTCAPSDLEPDARSLPRRFGREPSIENSGEMLGGDSLSIVTDCENQTVACTVERDRHRARLALRGVHRVANQIRQHLIQRPRVTVEVQR